jgi:uncharacterized protein YfaP (DUF2135 family)
MKFLLALISLNFLAAQDVIINNPKSGWRSSETEGIKFNQPVNYPASSANVPENQSTSAIIRGKIMKAR